MSRQYTAACGCKHKDTHLIQMCGGCAKDFNERHAQALKDYRASQDANKPQETPPCG